MKTNHTTYETFRNTTTSQWVNFSWPCSAFGCLTVSPPAAQSVSVSFVLYITYCFSSTVSVEDEEQLVSCSACESFLLTLPPISLPNRPLPANRAIPANPTSSHTNENLSVFSALVTTVGRGISRIVGPNMSQNVIEGPFYLRNTTIKTFQRPLPLL